MKAKLVCVSLMTRVIVKDDASDEEIAEAAMPQLIRNLRYDGILSNLESIEDDVEIPYNPEIDKA